MKKGLLLFFSITLLISVSKAQSNVGIGTNAPSEKLDVNGTAKAREQLVGVRGVVAGNVTTDTSKAVFTTDVTNKGFYIPRLTTAQKTSLGLSLLTANKGLLVFDTDLNRTDFWDGSNWIAVGTGAGGPPTGAAGGALTGTYPNPGIATGAVTTTQIFDGTITNADIANTTIDLTTKVTNVLPVPNGGTGRNSLDLNTVLVGNNSSPVKMIAPNNPGDILMSNGASVPTFTAMSGDATINSSGALTLANTGVGAATYGNATQVPQINIDAKGRILSASNVTISGVAPGGAASGDLTGNYPNPTIAANAVTSAKILDGTVTNADLQNSSVTVNTSGVGLSGGTTVSLGGSLTISSNATSNNTASTIVARDASGNFSAGLVTANFDGQWKALDNRTIAPNSITSGYAKFGFTSYNNNNTAPWADFLHLRSYTDASGGSDNLLVFNKSAIGMRLYQQSWNSGTAYTTFKDVAFTTDITGAVSGTTNRVAKFTGTNTIGNSLITDDGSTVRIGLVSNTNNNVWGWGNLLYLSGGGDDATWDSDNSDPLFIGRYNIASNSSDLRFTIGDDGGSNSDYLSVGTTSGTGSDYSLLVVRADGNVGIGTRDPAQCLELMRDNADVGIRMHDPGDYHYAMGIDRSDAGKFKINYGAGIGDADHFIMTTGGNVGIGVTPSYRMDINGDINYANGNIVRTGGTPVLFGNKDDVYANLRVIQNNSTVNQDGMYLNYNSTGTTGAHLRFYANGTTERGYVNAGNGNLYWHKNLVVSDDNTTGNGIYLADDGSIVDNNDGYATHRFSLGTIITDGNNTNGNRINLTNMGNVIATAGLVTGSIQIKSGPGTGTDGAWHTVQLDDGYAMINLSIYSTSRFDGDIRINGMYLRNLLNDGARDWYGADGNYSGLNGSGNTQTCDNCDHYASCPNNYIATGIQVYANSQLDYWGKLRCTALKGGFSTTETGPGVESAMSSPWGTGQDDQQHAAMCPPGTFVKGFRVYASNYWDGALRVYCTGITGK